MLSGRRKKRKKRRPRRSLVKINLKDKNPRETPRMRKDVVMTVECVTRLVILLQNGDSWVLNTNSPIDHTYYLYPVGFRIVLIEHCTNQEQVLGELTHDQTQETLHQVRSLAVHSQSE